MVSKKTVLTLLLGIFSANLFAQTFRVQSMVELTHDLRARVTPRLDAFGRECALIRINIPSIKDATFNSPIVGNPIIEPGEFSVYLPTESKDLQFECDGQSYKVDFSDYQISLQPKVSYRIVLLRNSSKHISNDIEVMVSANYDDDILLVDGMPVGQLPLLLDDIDAGPHTFSVPNTMGRVQKDTVINISSRTRTVRLYLKEEEQQFVKIDMMGYGDIEGWDVDFDEPQWGVRTEERDGKTGLVDYAGNIIVPFQYNNDIFIDEGGFYYVCQKREGDVSSHCGIFIPGKGEILPCRYTRCNPYGDIWVFHDGGEKQLFNIKTQQFVLSGDYEDIRAYDNKYIEAEDKQGNTIIMDEYGNQLLTVPHNEFPVFYPKEGLCWLPYKHRFYDLNGNSYMLPSQYVFCRVINGLIEVQDKNTKKMGYLNKYMREIIPVKYSYKRHDTYNHWEIEHAHGTILLETDEGDTIIFNNKGEIIAQTVPGENKSYKHLNVCVWDVHIICETWDGRFGVIDSAGITIVPFSFDKIESWHGCFEVYNPTDRRLTIYDARGNIILPTTKPKQVLRWGGESLEYYVDRNPHKVYVLSDEYLRVYNNKGVLIAQIPVEQDAKFDEQISMDKHDNYRILLNSGKNTIHSTKDDRLFQIVNNTTKKCGFISSTGELLTSCIYDELSNMIDFGNNPDDDYFKKNIYPTYSATINNYAASEGYGIIGLGGRYGFIDTKGNVVVPLIYTAVTPFINGVAYVRDQNNKWTKIYSKDLK